MNGIKRNENKKSIERPAKQRRIITPYDITRVVPAVPNLKWRELLDGGKIEGIRGVYE